MQNLLRKKSKIPVDNEDEKKSVTFQENTNSDDDHPVFHDRCANEDSDSYSFNIPIYCYDCPMSALVSIPDSNSDK